MKTQKEKKTNKLYDTILIQAKQKIKKNSKYLKLSSTEQLYTSFESAGVLIMASLPKIVKCRPDQKFVQGGR